MEVQEEERKEKQNQRTERLVELFEGEMEGKDLQIIDHRGHDHSLVLRESLQGDDDYGGGRVQVFCNGCREPICSSSSSSGVGRGGGDFYACPKLNCWFLLHKRCAELPPEIEHPSHPQHALTLHPFLLLTRVCDVCYSGIDGFLYCCSDCDFDVHVRCASMALHIQDRVDENKKIHKHPLIALEREAQFFCDICGREHKGKSYLCSTCGFWANQICASAPTTVETRRHPHPLTLFRTFRIHHEKCKICNEVVKTARWAYCCSEEECKYWVHIGCSQSEEAENSNKDIQTDFPSESTNHKIEIPADPEEDPVLITWPEINESANLITLLIKNLSLQGAIKCLRCRGNQNRPLIFVNKEIDEWNEDQLCGVCAQIISSQFYHCAKCNFSFHEGCAKLPKKLQHIFHPQHPLVLVKPDIHFRAAICHSCDMYSNGLIFGCFICHFYLDLKCALLPRLIKHRAHDHTLALRRLVIYSDSTNPYSCNACGVDEFFTFFRCEACNFGLCIQCAFLPSSVKHRYDEHPFALTYSPIEGLPNDYYCEICEGDINSMYWFYHCTKCDQSLHPECIYPSEYNPPFLN